MTVAVVIAVVVAAVAAALLATLLPPPLAVLAGAVLGTTAAAAAVWRQTARLRQVAGAVNARLGDDAAAWTGVGRGPGWDELDVALRALAAAYRRRGDKLRRERPWRGALVDAFTEPALLFSADERLLVANRAARLLLVATDQDRQLTALQSLGSATLAAAVRRARETATPVRLEADVAGRQLALTASPVGDETLAVVVDRTRERNLEALRRDFVANASHELKTPATGIQALADALDVTTSWDPARAAELVSRLRTEAQRLVRLVHDLLDLSRLEERGPLAPEPVDLTAVARDAIARLHDRAVARRVTVTLSASEPAVLAGVAADLRLIVENLVANAIAYNREGGSVAVALDRRDGAWALTVADTGIGIARNEVGRVFERFYRVDPARSHAAGGTGLGLAIVRHAVDRQCGHIEVDSLLGEGSTFTVTLPVTGPD